MDMNIKEIRKKLGLSQRALAEKVGVKRLTIARWESNQTKPNDEYLEILRNLTPDTTDTSPDTKLGEIVSSSQKIVSGQTGNCITPDTTQPDTPDTKKEKIVSPPDTILDENVSGKQEIVSPLIQKKVTGDTPNVVNLDTKLDYIPEELTTLNRWVTWKAPKKEPRNHKGIKCRINHPEDWSTFEQVKTAYTNGIVDGIGFVFIADDDLVGIDLDGVRNPETGEMVTWAEDIIEKANSYTEISPSGEGIHIILRGEKPGDNCDNEKGVEIYEKGRYFTVTGHILNEYNTINHRKEELNEIYDRYLNPKTTVQEAADYHLKQYVQKANIGNRNNTGLQLACQLHWLGLTQVEAEPYVLKYQQSVPQGEEEYTEQEALTTLKSAYNYEKRDPAIPKSQIVELDTKSENPDADAVFKQLTAYAKQLRRDKASRQDIIKAVQAKNEQLTPQLDAEQLETIVDNTTNPINAISAKTLLNMEIPEPVWAIPELIPAGLTILAGRPKLGKSWMALSFALAVACGGHALGKIPVDQGKALYFGLEDNLGRLQNRLTDLLEGEKYPDDLFVCLNLKRLDLGGIEQLHDWLNDYTGARLIVLDTLAKVRPMGKGKGDLYMEDYSAIGLLQKFAMDRGIAVLAVYHTRKAAADYALDEIAGTTGISGAADSALVLRKTIEGFVLDATGRDVETKELAVKRDRLVGWELLGDYKEYARSEQRRAIIDLLTNAEEPMSSKEIAEALERNRSTTRGLLKKMFADNEIESEKSKYIVNTTNSINRPNTVDSVDGNLFTVSNSVNSTVNSNNPNDSRELEEGVSPVSPVCGVEEGGGSQNDTNVTSGNELSERLAKYLVDCPEKFQSILESKLGKQEITLAKAVEASRRMAEGDNQGAWSVIRGD